MSAATLETSAETASHLDDADYEARLERLRAYVEQLEGADRQADTGSLQRATDLAAIYEDKRWIDDMETPEPSRRPNLFQVIPGSREQFYKWAKDHVTSPMTGQPLKKTTAQSLLDAEEVVRTVTSALVTVPEGAGLRTVKPLAKLIKDGRGEQAPAVWKRALKLAEADGQVVPGQALVKKALADHDKALGVKPPISKRTVESHQHKVEANFDWLVRHNTPEENRALLRRLAERLKAEHQWARGELAS